jgi:hypothetical protein
MMKSWGATKSPPSFLLLNPPLHYSITPALQRSIIPLFPLVHSGWGKAPEFISDQQVIKVPGDEGQKTQVRTEVDRRKSKTVL